MKISYNWLSELVTLTLKPQELAERLTMAGLAVEGLRAVSIPGTLFVIAFLSLFLWQMGRFFRRNRPGTYRPDAPPAELLPTA